jgi:hypothetical protein
MLRRMGILCGGLRLDGSVSFGKHQPEAVVLWEILGFAEHEDNLVADVDGVAAEHGADFGMERG